MVSVLLVRKDNKSSYGISVRLDKKAPLGAIQELSVSTHALMTYEIKVTTGDVKGAGTDANVFVNLLGDKVCKITFPIFPNFNIFSLSINIFLGRKRKEEIKQF